MKKSLLLILLAMMVNGQTLPLEGLGGGLNAQNWQTTTDKMWGNYCYREKNGKWYDAQTSKSMMSSMPGSEDIHLAYYWRIPKGKVRADIVWANNFARFASMNITLTYPETGDTLAVNTVSNTAIQSATHTDDLFGKVVDFPFGEDRQGHYTSSLRISPFVTHAKFSNFNPSVKGCCVGLTVSYAGLLHALSPNL